MILQIIFAILGVLAVSFAVASLFPPIFLKFNKPVNSIDQHSAGFKVKRFAVYSYLILMLIGWGVIYYNGTFAVLWFIPSDWGGVTDFGWQAARSEVSGFIATLAALATVHHLQKYSELFDQTND